MVSGRGSNLKAILESIKNGKLDAQVVAVISSKAGVKALEIAEEYKVPALAIESAGLIRDEHEAKVLVELDKLQFDYLMLAGYMRILSAQFLKRFYDPAGFYKVINIHPSLLPAFSGATAYDDAFAAGVAESGITIHLVDEQLDHGPILAQARFPRLPQDTIEEFKSRGLALEHQFLPATLQKIATGELDLCKVAQSKRAAEK
jgi:formyltetrahydrofolate-dependent phosphoribosylglycinamide formyltransferase